MAGITDSVGQSPLSYTGVNAAQPPNFNAENRPPTTKDYSNYRIGDLWLDLSPTKPPMSIPPSITNLWMLVDKRLGIATWINFGTQALLYLTGDTGGPVGLDDEDNIDLLGTANHIVTTGTPAAHQIVWDVGSHVAVQFNTDGDPAVPDGSVLEILGGTGIVTSGAGNTITVSVSGDVATRYTADDATFAVPVNNNLNVAGGVAISTTAAGDTLTLTGSDAIPLQFTADGPTIAVPVGNNLNILGGIGVTTTASGDTITIDFSSVSPPTSFFNADVSAIIPSVTGNSATYLIIFDREWVDVDGNYDNATGLYTAPSDGLYQFTSTVSFESLASGMNSTYAYFEALGTGAGVGTWTFIYSDAFLLTNKDLDLYAIQGSVLLLLDANDTVSVKVRVGGGSGNNAGIQGSATANPVSETWFSGYQIAGT